MYIHIYMLLYDIMLSVIMYIPINVMVRYYVIGNYLDIIYM
jgi:hypothetical protein